MAIKVYKGDTGTEIILDCGVSIDSTDTIADIKVRNPDKSVVTWDGDVYNSDYIRYIIEEGDLDLPGYYYLQAYVEMDGGIWRGETVKLTVYDHFK